MIFHIKLKSQHDILKRKLILSCLKETFLLHEIEEDILICIKKKIVNGNHRIELRFTETFKLGLIL